ncbi:MAG TPA: glycoside hydrolase family 6 protein [Polyangiaceae bacterium]|nr:glycoside hydrolase family 6 protein [Polyangiaceae bacterium]
MAMHLKSSMPILACALATLTPSLAAADALDPHTKFYTPDSKPAAYAQIQQLKRHHQRDDAELIQKLIDTPHAAWFTGGTPREVTKDVKKLLRVATAHREVPVLVAYNIPFRDCAQFSAGGATSVEEYLDWIDAFAKGIGSSKAIVILEPDGLGIIPWYNPFAARDSWEADPNKLEWCQPAEADPATAAADRFFMLHYAVTKLKALGGTRVYMDGTHTGWLGSGDAADRLYQAGVSEADGFYLNASNYRSEEQLVKYGTWVSKCLWFGDSASGSWGAGHFEWCGSQYSPANPGDFSTWGLTDDWYTNNVESQTWVPYPGDEGLKRFVIDTSRNGEGPWTPTAAYSDPQDWCNPPGRGVGLTPSANTGVSLLDATLWIKVPGESDGECNRGLGPAGTTVDPEWGLIDPAAGDWFPQMALQLAHNASPSLLSCGRSGH